MLPCLADRAPGSWRCANRSFGWPKRAFARRAQAWGIQSRTRRRDTSPRKFLLASTITSPDPAGTSRRQPSPSPPDPKTTPNLPPRRTAYSVDPRAFPATSVDLTRSQFHTIQHPYGRTRPRTLGRGVARDVSTVMRRASLQGLASPSQWNEPPHAVSVPRLWASMLPWSVPRPGNNPPIVAAPRTRRGFRGRIRFRAFVHYTALPTVFAVTLVGASR